MNNELKRNEINQDIKTPVDVMLEMAQNEIKIHVLECMRVNRIPPALMVYILKSIELNIYELKDKQLAEYYVELQKSTLENESQEG